MTQIPKNGSTNKQKIYALKSFAGEGSKKQIALDAGYTLNAANSVKTKIENTTGFKNAMVDILKESDNVVLNVFAEFKSRGFKEFDNKELLGALSVITTAWSKFNEVDRGGEGKEKHSKLRTIIMQQVENQTVNTLESPKEKVIDAEPVEDLGF
jgi:hypothetical protein